jgi:SET domain-containing protein
MTDTELFAFFCYSTPVKKRTSSKFKIARSAPGRGCGLYARIPFKKGEFVAEYTGTRISTQRADELKTKYLFEIDARWTIDGSARSNIARYINHSCVPNCETDVIDDKIMIFALKDIAVGDELTFDYGDEYFDEFIRPHGCKCEQCIRAKVPGSL